MSDCGVFSAHNVQRLLARWRKVAVRSSMEMRTLATAAGLPIVVLARGEAQFYFSAGIHGDEPAGCEGLVTWAEAAWDFLQENPCLIFPCLNPWGLLHNSRLNENGRDLNRGYDGRRHSSVVAAHRKLLRGKGLRKAITLHEDFDGCGVYVYGLGKNAEKGARCLLHAAAGRIPVETRSMVDGRRCRNGLILRRRSPAHLPGKPEAVWLWEQGCESVFTVETPSEFDLTARVAAHVAALEEFQRLCAEGAG